MVSAALCYYLASICRKKFLIVGDPMQLGPVYSEIVETYDDDSNEAKVERWLGNNVFTTQGVIKPEAGRLPIVNSQSNLYVLNRQRRSANSIWEVVEHLYPKMDLDSINHSDLVSLPPFANLPVVIADTSEVKDFANTSQFVNRSRFNEYSAGLTMKLVLDFYHYNMETAVSGNIKTSVITPYRAQAKRLKSFLKDDSLGPIAKLIKIGTIHSFQGDESEIVYVDLVESRINKKLGKILLDEQGISLINVASSRAKAKLVYVINTKHFVENEIERSNPLLFEILKRFPSMKIVDTASEMPDNHSDTKWENMFRNELIRQLHDREVRTRTIYPDFVQQYEIVDERGKVITRPDFAWPDLKIAVFVDGASVHFYDRDVWNRDHFKRNRIASDGWTPILFSNERITKELRDCVQEAILTLDKRIKATGYRTEPHNDTEFHLESETKRPGWLF